MDGKFPEGLMRRMRHESRKTVAAVVFAALALGACASKPQPVAPTALHLNDRSQVLVDATSIAIDIQAHPPREYPQMAYQSPIGFDQALDTWVKAHFVLSGNTVNTFKITLRTGDIVEKRLPMDHGTKAWFKKQQAAEYDAELGLSVAVVSPDGKVLASADGTSTDMRTSPQDATEADIRVTLASMVETLFNNLDAEMQPRLRASLAQYIHPAQ